jgi:hypothetical protein
MGFIWLGIVLIVLGLLLSLFIGGGGMLVNVGWLVLILGVVLAVLSYAGVGGGRRLRDLP